MGYTQYLCDMLAPLKVYKLTPESFSGGELAALGAALDELWDTAQTAQRESIPATACGEGLRAWESLFPHRAMLTEIAARRAAIGGFLSISGDSFTAAALSRCLSACGVSCQLRESAQPGTLTLSFPDVMGRPERFEEIMQIAAEILPCHLAVEYLLRWCLWGDIAAYTWGDFSQMTWGELACYRT